MPNHGLCPIADQITLSRRLFQQNPPKAVIPFSGRPVPGCWWMASGNHQRSGDAKVCIYGSQPVVKPVAHLVVCQSTGLDDRGIY